MKQRFLSLLFLCFVVTVTAQQRIENLIIVTTDGFRWQEVYKGMDSTIANDKRFNQRDSSGIYQKYWSDDKETARKKLLPFIWNTMAVQGRLYGNRTYGNKMDNANPYWFSYPGYNEIFTGYPDAKINTNSYPYNPDENVLEFINRQPGFRGRVAAFTAWDAFDRILNKKRCGFPVLAAFDTCCLPAQPQDMPLLNAVAADSYKPFGGDECLDVFTHYKAMAWLKKAKPRVLYISYGETDEWAHAGKYKDYLNVAHQVDQWLQQIWDYVQSDTVYKNKTALLVTVDHGRGDTVKEQWTSHGQSVTDSHEIWFAVMGPGIPATGEIKQPGQLYQQQLAQTIASLLGLRFTASHPVADKIPLAGQ